MRNQYVAFLIRSISSPPPAPPYTTLSVANPNSIDDAIPGGLGIPLIRSFDSDIDCASVATRDQLTLRFVPPAGRET